MSKYELKKIAIEKMERGDILLMSPYKNLWKYPIATLINWGTESEWSHGALYLGKGLIIESNGKHGVHISTIHHGKYNNDYDWITLRVKPEYKYTIEPTIKYAESKMWKGYDFFATYWLGFIFALKKIFNISINKFLKNDNILESKDRYFCFELVTDAYAAAGIDIPKEGGIDAGNIVTATFLNSNYLDLIEKE